MIVAPGATSVSVDIFWADDTGAAVTGKVAADFPVVRWSGGSNTADTTITISDLAAITTAHPNDNTAGGVKEREGGWYRLDLPNNVVSAAGRKTITFAETTNKRIIAPFVDCQYPQTDVRQLLGTAWLTPGTAGTPDVNVKLWNALSTVALPLVPATPGRTLVVDAAGLADANAVKVGPTGAGTAQTARDLGTSVLLSSGTGTGQVSLSSGAVTVGTNSDKTGYTVSTVSDKTGYSLSSGGVQAIWDALTSALTTVGSIGKLLVTNIDALISSRTKPADTQAAVTTVTNLTNAPTVGDFNATMKTSLNAATPASVQNVSAQTGDSYARLGAPAGVSHAADVAAVNAKTTNLPAAPASTTNITAGTITTVTNLTNAPTAGDLTATMKTSVTAAVPTASTIAAAVLAAAVESGVSVQQMLEAIGAACAGNYHSSDGSFRAVGNGSTTRLTSTLSGGDRTNVPSL